jgi:hypothetical protein
MRGDPVDLVHQLRDLHLDLHPVLVGVDAIGGLYRQFAEAMQDIVRFGQIPFGGLNEGDRVLYVASRLVQAPDLGSELLRYGQTRGIVASPVDSHPRGELLDILVD